MAIALLVAGAAIATQPGTRYVLYQGQPKPGTRGWCYAHAANPDALAACFRHLRPGKRSS